MSNNEFLSQSEIDEIEKIEIDTHMLDRVKARQQNTFHTILMNDLLKSLKEKLDIDEEIEFNFSGRDYTSDSTRLLFASFLSGIAHPIFGWSANCILIKTNKRLLLVEVTGYLQYSNHYEIKEELHLVKEKEYFYFLIEDLSGKKKVLQLNIVNLDAILDLIKDSIPIIYDRKLKLKTRLIFKIIYILQILFILFVLYNFIINWNKIIAIWSNGAK